MRLSEFLRSPYSSTELCSILPASIIQMDPELEWEDPGRSPELTSEALYPEEVEVTFQRSASGCRFSFDLEEEPSHYAQSQPETIPPVPLSSRSNNASSTSERSGSGMSASDNSAGTNLKSANMNPTSSQDNLEALRGGRNSDKDGSDFHFAGPNHMEHILTEDQDLPVHALPMNSEIRLYENGSFRGLICYEMKYERATLITLEPTEWHSKEDRDFVHRASATLKSPGINWYVGYGWGALAQIRSDEEDCSVLVFKESSNRYTMEFYYPGGLEELGESLQDSGDF